MAGHSSKLTEPCVLIGSCGNFKPENLVQRILSSEIGGDAKPKESVEASCLPEGNHVREQIHSYPWHIDTKYYTADILLCTTQARTIGDKQFADLVQAVVLYFDSNSVSSFDEVNSWLPFLDQLEANVQILVCDNVKDNDVISRHKTQLWCLDHSFELVELNPTIDENDDTEDDFYETTGVQRVIQALHAHMWPNLIMKDKPSFHSRYFEELKAAEMNGHGDLACGDRLSELSVTDSEPNSSNSKDESVKTNGCSSHGNAVTNTSTSNGHSVKSDSTNGTNVAAESSKEKIDSLFADEDNALLESLTNDDPDDESFEALFSRMREMKEKAESLPEAERRAYAEKVAISFWKAIGGDEDEIEGLSDSD